MASPGPKRTNRRSRLTATAIAVKMIEDLMGKAGSVLDEAVSKTQEVALIDSATGMPQVDEDGSIVTKIIGGDSRVAMWMFDRVWPKKGAVLPVDMNVDVSTMDGVIKCGQMATEMVISRRMSVGDAQDLLDYLFKYAQLRAYERLDELKMLVESFEAETAVTAQVDGHLVPKWGRLKADTKVANKVPAE